MEQAVAALYRAMLGHDIPALSALLSDDCVYVHSTGLTESKAQFLDGVRDGLYVYDRVAPESQRIVVNGDMAMVYAILDFLGGPRGAGYAPTRLVTTLVWTWQDGRWRLILRQATRIP